MSDIQREAYADTEAVTSDPVGLVGRDNRNHRKKCDIILDHVAASAGDSVLEVGCGHGVHTARYADAFDVTAIDISPSLVAATRRRTDGAATVQQADATTLPYADDTFDAVVGTAILHHLADQEQALAEWIRVTNPGGSVTLMEPNYLFPLAFATTHLLPEERHKRGMAVWRLKNTLEAATTPGAEWTLEPRLYTPPWPAAATPLFDALDSVGRRVPVARWASQMLLLHVTV